MSDEKHDFESSFAKLVAAIKSQSDGKTIISFNDDLIKLFRDTTSPKRPEVLQEFARLLEGPKRQGLSKRQGLFLRLDGPAIFMVVSTVLQFPFSWLLSKITYFFIDTLVNYKNDSKALVTLQRYVDAPDLRKEVKRRQRHIFSQLLQRLRELLFDQSMDIRVRRLVARLIVALCEDHAAGWRGLMNHSNSQCLFGSLFRTLNDYVLRMLIADIIRLLRSQNYQMHEIWDRTDEHAMDFPSSQNIHGRDLETTLTAMSAMDTSRAFSNNGIISHIFQIADINIPSLKVHSSQSDTICVLDDGITLLLPNEESGKTTFKIYEVPIIKEMVVETGTNGPPSAAISWTQSKGHVFLRGRKIAVEALFLQFTKDRDRFGFIEKLKSILKRLDETSWPQTASQEHTTEQPRQRRCSIAVLPLLSEAEDSIDEEEADLAPTPCDSEQVHELHIRGQGQPAKVHQAVLESSSDYVIGRSGPSSDVFRPGNSDRSSQVGLTEVAREDEESDRSEGLNSHENEEESEPKCLRLRGRLLASKAQHTHNVMTANTPASDESEQQVLSSPSPLEQHGKRERGGARSGREGAIVHRAKLHAQDPALTQSLTASNDQDFASFTESCKEASVLSQQENNDPPTAQATPSLDQQQTADRAEKHRLEAISQTQARKPQARLSKAATAMKRPRKVKVAQSQQTTSSPAKKSMSTLNSVNKLNSWRAANSSVHSANHGQGTQAEASGTNKPAAGGTKARAKRQQQGEGCEADDDIYELGGDPVEANMIKLKPNNRKTAAATASKKPLKGAANLTGRPDSQAKAAKKTTSTKAGKTKQPARSQLSAPLAPTRRSQRVVARIATAYREPPKSEADEEGEHGQEEFGQGDMPDDQEDADEYKNQTWASQQKPKSATSNKVAMPPKQASAFPSVCHTGPAPTCTNETGGATTLRGDDAGRDGTLPKHGINLPSSDMFMESELDHIARPPQHITYATAKGVSDAAQKKSAAQMIAEDSCPRQTQARRSGGDADQSFGAKLRSFATTTPMPRATAGLRRYPAPFGDAGKFIQDIKGTQGSTSPVRKQPASPEGQSNGTVGKELQHLGHGVIQLLGSAPRAEQSVAAQQSDDEDMEALLAVQHEVVTAKDTENIPAMRGGTAAAEQIRRPDEVTGASLGNSHNDDNYKAAQLDLNTPRQPEAEVASPGGREEYQKQSTAKSVEILDSHDQGATDYSILSNEVAAAEALSTAKVAPVSKVQKEVVQKTAQQADAAQDMRRDHDRNQQKADSLVAQAHTKLASTADKASRIETKRPATRIRPYRDAVQTPVSHLSELRRPATASVGSAGGISKTSRKSSLIHFGSTGAWNQGLPSKVESDATIHWEARVSLDELSAERPARHMDLTNDALTDHRTATISAIEDDGDDTIFGGGNIDLDEGRLPGTSRKATMQEAEIPPQSETSTQTDVHLQKPADSTCEHKGFIEEKIVPSTRVKDHAAEDAALDGGECPAQANESNDQYRVNEVIKDAYRTQVAPVPNCNIAQTHESSEQVASCTRKTPDQTLPTRTEAASRTRSAHQAYVKTLTDSMRLDENRPTNESTAKERDAFDMYSTQLHGGQSGRLANRTASISSQASSRKSDQVATSRVRQANIAKTKRHVQISEVAPAEIQIDDKDTSALECLRSTIVSGIRAPATPKALAPAHRGCTQGRSNQKVGYQTKSPSAPTEIFPQARSEHQNSQLKRALVQQQQFAQTGNSQESPIDISSTGLFSGQDSFSQSEQELDFEASAVDELLSLSEYRRATRQTAPRSEQSHSSPSVSEERPEEEHSPPPAKRRKTTKAQEMTQTMARRSQGPDDISQFVRKQFPQTRSTISFTKVPQAERLTDLPLDPDLSNVFSARDLPTARCVQPTVSDLQSHGAYHGPKATAHHISAHSQPMPTRKVQSPKTNMPAPARPIPKVDHRSVLIHNPPLVHTSDKADAHQWESAKPRSNDDHSKSISNIKRIRQVRDSPVQLSQAVAPACTPQPFHERLHAATSPASDAEPFFASGFGRISVNQSQGGETTLVEPWYLLRNTMPRSPPAMSTNQDSKGSASPEPDDHPPRFGNAQLNHVLGTSGIQQSLQQAILAMTQDICIRFEHEEEAARVLVQRYHGGCTKMLDELKYDARARLKHDAMKLMKSTKELQARIKNTADMVSKTSEKDDQTVGRVTAMSLEEVTSRGQGLLEMLDGVVC